MKNKDVRIEPTIFDSASVETWQKIKGARQWKEEGDRLNSRLRPKDRGRKTDRGIEQGGRMPSRRTLVWQGFWAGVSCP